MKVKYKNNTDKLIYLGLPGIFLLIGYLLDNMILTALGIIFTVSVSSIVFQYIYNYRKGKIVIETANNVLIIRSNGKYDIPLKDINVLEITTNKKGKRKQLEITYVKNGVIKKISLVDLYDMTLEEIQKQIRKEKKKSV